MIYSNWTFPSHASMRASSWASWDWYSHKVACQPYLCEFGLTLTNFEIGDCIMNDIKWQSMSSFPFKWEKLWAYMRGPQTCNITIFIHRNKFLFNIAYTFVGFVIRMVVVNGLQGLRRRVRLAYCWPLPTYVRWVGFGPLANNYTFSPLLGLPIPCQFRRSGCGWSSKSCYRWKWSWSTMLPKKYFG